MQVKEIKIDDYSYNLPNHRIAKYPANERDQSKLLYYKSGEISTKHFGEIHSLLSPETLLVMNNTKVIHARLVFYKTTGARIEVFCLEPLMPADYSQNFQQTERCIWKCAIGNLKRWKSGILQMNFSVNNINFILQAKQLNNDGRSYNVEFSWKAIDNELIEKPSFVQVLEITGKIPIPPYLNREAEECDTNSYQTVYSKSKGSVAAPTAGLHFTDSVFNSLKNNNIACEEITLHVGAGTFVPVKCEQIGDHPMHTEHFSVSKKCLTKIIAHLGKITAVGTTSVRTLESLFWLSIKLQKQLHSAELHIAQWEVYNLEGSQNVNTALNWLLQYMEKNNMTELRASTAIIIVPSYSFRVVNSIITNFHQPKSTLLLLIAAFVGNSWKDIYNYALQNDFRFLSYGDSSLLIPCCKTDI